MDDIIKLIVEQQKENISRVEKRLDRIENKLDKVFYFKAKMIGAASLIAALISIGARVLFDF